VIRLAFALPHGERAHRRALIDYGRLAAVSLLDALAATTTRIRLATGIVNIFSRSPGTKHGWIGSFASPPSRLDDQLEQLAARAIG
jgi:hypothetical protein